MNNINIWITEARPPRSVQVCSCVGAPAVKHNNIFRNKLTSTVENRVEECSLPAAVLQGRAHFPTLPVSSKTLSAPAGGKSINVTDGWRKPRVTERSAPSTAEWLLRRGGRREVSVQGARRFWRGRRARFKISFLNMPFEMCRPNSGWLAGGFPRRSIKGGCFCLTSGCVNWWKESVSEKIPFD